MRTSSALPTDFPATPGLYQRTIAGPEAQTFDYTIRIPTGYDGQTPVPVILCLHFGGQATPFYGRLFLELIPEPAWRDLCAVLVAPTSPYGNWTIPASEALVWTVLQEVEQSLRINTGQRVVMGYSLGGIGTWHLAATFRQKFVAAIPIAGAPRQTSLQALRDLPLYVIHSREDSIVPMTGDEEAVASLQSQGAPVVFAPLPTGDHFEYRLVIAELRTVATWLKQVWQHG